MFYLNGRQPLKVNFKEDEYIEINGQKYYPLKEENKTTDFYYKRTYYDTIEELMIAKMLTCMNIPFLHHVTFSYSINKKGKPRRIWRPDFVFACAQRWIGGPCNGSVIIGIEVKRNKMSGARRKSRILLEEREIPIIILKRKDIEDYYDPECMKLPLKQIS
ncbi:MAG: hypothetical protein U5L76_04070 [Patescibacteria group bacterium]|nr:hypothetical protein [Patescibacteria group bacterium]